MSFKKENFNNGAIEAWVNGFPILMQLLTDELVGTNFHEKDCNSGPLFNERIYQPKEKNIEATSDKAIFQEMRDSMLTQDDRRTRDVYYVVLQPTFSHGHKSDYSDSFGWLETEDSENFYEKGDDFYDTLNTVRELSDTYEEKVTIDDVSYHKIYSREAEPRFLTATVTEKAAIQWLERNKHNYRGAYTYGVSAHNNPEIKGIKKFIENFEDYKND